jgi:hypothetical protein
MQLFTQLYNCVQSAPPDRPEMAYSINYSIYILHMQEKPVKYFLIHGFL